MVRASCVGFLTINQTGLSSFTASQDTGRFNSCLLAKHFDIPGLKCKAFLWFRVLFILVERCFLVTCAEDTAPWLESELSLSQEVILMDCSISLMHFNAYLLYLRHSEVENWHYLVRSPAFLLADYTTEEARPGADLFSTPIMLLHSWSSVVSCF